MNCIKCGKKTKGDQVFCSSCLKTMEAYPVKPDAHIQIPVRRSVPAAKKNWLKRRTVTVEEQVEQLRKWIRRLIVAVIALTVLLGVTGAILVQQLMKEEESNLGKNYTVDSTME